MKMKHILFTIFALLVLCSFLPLPAQAASPVEDSGLIVLAVAGDSVRVRRCPSVECDILGGLDTGAVLVAEKRPIEDDNMSWYKVIGLAGKESGRFTNALRAFPEASAYPYVSATLVQPYSGELSERDILERAMSTLTIESAGPEQKLLGKHMFSLQWISWEKFGTANITRKDGGGLYIDALQELNGDYVILKGDVRVANAREFTVIGELVTRVHHINGGEPCTRNETFTFKATGTRKYWRMQEMVNPCDNVADYVDVFF